MTWTNLWSGGRRRRSIGGVGGCGNKFSIDWSCNNRFMKVNKDIYICLS